MLLLNSAVVHGTTTSWDNDIPLDALYMHIDTKTLSRVHRQIRDSL